MEKQFSLSILKKNSFYEGGEGVGDSGNFFLEIKKNNLKHPRLGRKYDKPPYLVSVVLHIF